MIERGQNMGEISWPWSNIFKISQTKVRQKLDMVKGHIRLTDSVWWCKNVGMQDEDDFSISKYEMIVENEVDIKR